MDQQADNLLWKAAGIDKLEKYKYFNLVDGLVKAYPQYTHKNIEELPYQEVMNMVGFNKEYGKISSIYNENKNKANG